MYAVVNHFPLAKPVDDELARRMEGELIPQARQFAGFRAFHFVRVSDEEAIVVALFDTQEALDATTQQLAAPWFGSHLGPYFGGPPRRSVGEVIASSDG